MTAGVVGLGLIGGSVAKAYKRTEGIRVLAANRNKAVLDFAFLAEAVDEVLTMDNIGQCDVLLLCTYPAAAVEYLKSAAPYIGKDTVVIDCLGTKREVCAAGFELAKEYGFTYVGGHPMAGTHNSGFKYAREDMFDGAPMVIVPPEYDDMELLGRIKDLLEPLGFGSISVTTAERHDELIAFTSQMPHIISNAYVKSPRATAHKGFSAGSYRDLTRVAWLNPGMWTELFLENGDNLINELDFLIDELGKYRAAIAEKNAAELERLLDEGRIRKKEIDGR